MASKIMAFTMVVVAEKVMDDKPTHRTEHGKTRLMALRTQVAAASELVLGRLTNVTCAR